MEKSRVSPFHPSMQRHLRIAELEPTISAETINGQVMQILGSIEIMPENQDINFRGNIEDESDLRIGLRVYDSENQFGPNRRIAQITVKTYGLNGELVLDSYRLVREKGMFALYSPKKVRHNKAEYVLCNPHQVELVSDILSRSIFKQVQ